VCHRRCWVTVASITTGGRYRARATGNRQLWGFEETWKNNLEYLIHAEITLAGVLFTWVYKTKYIFKTKNYVLMMKAYSKIFSYYPPFTCFLHILLIEIRMNNPKNHFIFYSKKSKKIILFFFKFELDKKIPKFSFFLFFTNDDRQFLQLKQKFERSYCHSISNVIYRLPTSRKKRRLDEVKLHNRKIDKSWRKKISSFEKAIRKTTSDDNNIYIPNTIKEVYYDWEWRGD